MLKSVHHINLLVRDLEAAVTQYQSAFAIEAFEYGDLAARGVRTARFKAGETWIVLVQPTDPDSAPGRQLAEKGEGLFLLSFEVDSLAAASTQIAESANGLSPTPPREGLNGWHVRDLDPQVFCGANLQITEDSAHG